MPVAFPSSLRTAPARPATLRWSTSRGSQGDAGAFGVFANSMVSTNPFVPQLTAKTVDPSRDVVPVAAMADMILVLAASTQLGVNALEQFLAKARAPGQRLRIGLAGWARRIICRRCCWNARPT